MNNDSFSDVQIRFGQLVKEKRIKLGLSQARLAEIIFSNKRSILDIELGRGNPTLETVYKLITFLKINSHSIFYPEPVPPSEEVADFMHMLEGRSEKELHMLKHICHLVLDFADDVTHTSAV